MKTINVGLIGAGTIGQGVIDLLRDNGDLISKRSGVKINLKSVCDNNSEALENIGDIEGLAKTTDYINIINDGDIDIVIELVGGLSPAKDIVIGAMNQGKHVVTANKALLSRFWEELRDAATSNNVFINFEASVGGAIPVVKAIRKSFVGNKIELIFGILNGTTNFILSKMADEGYSFEKSLQVAQKKGIAEKDPTMDISGKDSAYKLAILSILGFNMPISADDIYVEGIENVTPIDIKFARNWGYVIKLLAIAKNTDRGLQLRVHPTLIPEYHLLAGVKGEDNAVFIKGDFIGESLLYGKGAGSHPTASSVVGDVVEIAEQVGVYGEECFSNNILKNNDLPLGVVDHDKLKIPYFLRFSALDKPGVLSKISGILAENNISISRMSQEERKKDQAVPVIMLSHKALEGDMRKAISGIDDLEVVTNKTVAIPIEG